MAGFISQLDERNGFYLSAALARNDWLFQKVYSLQFR